jgi:hypothetical protein
MATKKYKTFTPVVTTSAVLSTVPNVDGQLVVTKDGGGIYYDDGTNRTLVSKDSTKLSSSGTATQASKAYNTYSSVGTSGKYYYPLSTISASSAYIQPAAVGDVKVYEVGNSSATGYSQLMLGNSSSGTSKRIGKIQLYGSSSGTTTITPGNSTTTANTLTLPSTTGTLLTSESAAGTYLPLTGGTLSGDLFVGDSSKTTESKLGVNSAGGEFYMFSAQSTGNRGLWDSNLSKYVLRVDSNNLVHYANGYVVDTLIAGYSTTTTQTALKVLSSIGYLSLYSNPASGIQGLWDSRLNNTIVQVDSNSSVLLRPCTVDGSLYAKGDIEAKSRFISAQGGYNRTGLTGTQGTWGYVLVMSIQFTGTYPNKPITFSLHFRRRVPVDLAISLTSVSDLSQGAILYFYGMNILEDVPVYAIYNSSSATLNIYASKSEGWDSVSVSNLTFDQSYLKATVSYPGTFYESMPSGYTQATRWIPNILSGTSTPSSSTGVNGDIYLVYS